MERFPHCSIQCSCTLDAKLSKNGMLFLSDVFGNNGPSLPVLSIKKLNLFLKRNYSIQILARENSDILFYGNDLIDKTDIIHRFEELFINRFQQNTQDT